VDEMHGIDENSRKGKETAGPSTSLRSGRDDNSVSVSKSRLKINLSSREAVTFPIFSCLLHTYTRSSTAPQNRHPERSASQIRPIKKGLPRGVEGPRRCSLADALLVFPATNYEGNEKVTSSDQRIHGHSGPPKVVKNAFCPATTLHGSVTLPFVIPSVAEGSAVLRTIPGNIFRQSVAKWRDLLFLSEITSHTPSLALVRARLCNSMPIGAT
jgi:hypothetical protein